MAWLPSFPRSVRGLVQSVAVLWRVPLARPLAAAVVLQAFPRPRVVMVVVVVVVFVIIIVIIIPAATITITLVGLGPGVGDVFPRRSRRHA